MKDLKLGIRRGPLYAPLPGDNWVLVLPGGRMGLGVRRVWVMGVWGWGED